MREDSPELCGKQVKSRFFDMKSTQLGRRYTPAPRWNSPELWAKIGRNCLECRADPRDFVLAAFRFNMTPGGPFPNQLTSTAARNWHAKLKDQTKDVLPGSTDLTVGDKEIHRLLRCRMSFMLAMSPAGRRLYLLMPASDLTAWERILLGSGRKEVRDAYLPAAQRELAANLRIRDALERLGWKKELKLIEEWKTQN